jgi:glycosyltransferase involved in cell wall biosynthesis
MTARVLHVLSQRPSLTGSGITLDALVRCAGRAGYDQLAVVGTPVSDPAPVLGGLPQERVRPLRFGTDALPFALPGMSDVMPYPSSRFGALSAAQIGAYLEAWRSLLAAAIADFRPQLIHAHHVWLVSSLLREIAKDVPIVVHCHATGIRQMALAPHLAERVRTGCARADRFAVLHADHARALALSLGVPADRVHVVGAGYRDDLFHAIGRGGGEGRVAYVGKLSAAKGLRWLLDAFERLGGDATLHVVGDGSGPEAEALRERMRELSPRVTAHGTMSQRELAGLLRRCDVCALPSFFEGLPLVLVEAFACGCRIVSTDLPGVASALAPHLGDALTAVRTPRLDGPDVPRAEDLPAFVDDLEAALRASLAAEPVGTTSPAFAAALAPFSWGAVFGRVEAIWRELLPPNPSRLAQPPTPPISGGEGGPASAL